MTASEADSTKSKARNQERGEDEAGGPLVDWCYSCCFFSASASLFFIPCFSFSPPLPLHPTHECIIHYATRTRPRHIVRITRPCIRTHTSSQSPHSISWPTPSTPPTTPNYTRRSCFFLLRISDALRANEEVF